MKLENLKSFDEYLVEGAIDYEIDETSEIFEADDTEMELYFDGELYEATAPKLTGVQRKKALAIGQLMKAVNKSEAYKAAKDKFVKVFKMEAKKAVSANKLNPKVLKQLDKITLRDV